MPIRKEGRYGSVRSFGTDPVSNLSHSVSLPSWLLFFFWIVIVCCCRNRNEQDQRNPSVAFWKTSTYERMRAHTRSYGFTWKRRSSFRFGRFLRSGRSYEKDEDRKKILIQYVEQVQPQVLEEFWKNAPEDVVQGMKETVAELLGSLPPRFFDVRIRTIGESLAQLMCTVIMTGYMFRNAKYRKELSRNTSFHEESTSTEDEGDTYAPGTQKKGLRGHVLRWNLRNEGAEITPVNEYVEELEREVKELKDRVNRLARKESDPESNLLRYVRGLEPHNLQELTSSAGEDVLEAMNAFVRRIMLASESKGSDDSRPTEQTAVELARLLYWLLVVGYSLRTLEVRFDMERSFQLPISPAPKGLPPGV